MPGLSDHQNVFRIEKSDTRNKGAENRVVKRNRQPVSCVGCRTKKLKCDRQVPCSSCVKRGRYDAASCSYSSGNRNERGKRDRAGESKNAEAHLRLQKLEDMVTGLLQSTNEGSESNGNSAHADGQPVDRNLEDLSLDSSLRTVEACSGARGHLEISRSETKYLGATHWTAILEDIRGIQVALEPEEEEDEQTPSPLGCSDILFETNKSLTLTDVRKTLGGRASIDKLLSTYFSHRHNQTPILHMKKFMREYDSFWADPTSASFLWISMLFSALYIGTQIVEARSEGDVDLANRSLGEEFLTRAGQALVAGKYSKARPYSVESLLLYTVCQHFRENDHESNTWLLMSVCARMAMRMGYHHDPRHLGHFSPFEAEMRRRTFFTIWNLDFLLSFQAGMPSVIPDEVCDTENPSNLFDTDFDEDCAVLPPSRPPTDPTPMLYSCYKSRLGKVLRRGFRLALAVKRPSYEQTMRLDGELQEIHADVPPSLQMRPIVSCFGEQSYMILHRFNLDLMYLKTLCVLHRNYINHERSNPVFDYSRKTCIEAALKILKYQAEIHAACQPGGQLNHEKWMPSSLLIYDYLLAVMLICLDLFESRKSTVVKSHKDQLADVKKYEALKVSYKIWSSQPTMSREDRRASSVLAAILSKLPPPNVPATPVTTPRLSSDISLAGESTNGMTSASLWGPVPDWSATGFGAPGQDPTMNNYVPLDFNLADPLNTIFTGSEDLDWELIDQCLLGQNAMDVPMSNTF
ncbi:Fusarisetin A cluster transcription factor [Lachnellula occidentalis]|uniref:Fusarisetin A cluster transcription factor n=1 Tax=Lachnellula occidentalis TaxID=215460 RepID=A0A8H8S6X9_9HELO|nr:Fusarisetin A cluster transcription factor [Lachnellula occidentalis]